MNRFRAKLDFKLGKKKKKRCWEGYEPVPGKEPYSEDSCRKKEAVDELTQQHIRETGFLPGPGEAKGDPIEAYVCPGCSGKKKNTAQCKKCKSQLNKSRKRRGLKKGSEENPVDPSRWKVTSNDVVIEPSGVSGFILVRLPNGEVLLAESPEEARKKAKVWAKRNGEKMMGKGDIGVIRIVERGMEKTENLKSAKLIEFRNDCDGSGPHTPDGPVKRLPVSAEEGGPAEILCRACWGSTMLWRQKRNQWLEKELKNPAQYERAKFPIIPWAEGQVEESGPERRAEGDEQNARVCPNCKQWQTFSKKKGYRDCMNDCAQRGFAPKEGALKRRGMKKKIAEMDPSAIDAMDRDDPSQWEAELNFFRDLGWERYGTSGTYYLDGTDYHITYGRPPRSHKGFAEPGTDTGMWHFRDDSGKKRGRAFKGLVEVAKFIRGLSEPI